MPANRFLNLQSLRRATSVFALSILLGACVGNPEKAVVEVQPRTAPSKNITSFTESLTCMDRLLAAHGKADIFLTSAGVPDATGKIRAGTKEMLITAISRMSTRSRAFRFVDFDPTQTDVHALSSLIGIHPTFVLPNYYMRGAITQLDENVLDDLVGASASLPDVEVGVSRDQVVSIVSIDLNMGELLTRQIIPGLSANNSIAVISSGKGADASGRIKKLGLSFNIQLSRNEGVHQAVRTLIDLSVIEVLGKLAHVPYWQCLQIDATNPTLRAQARDWYDSIDGVARVRFVRQALASLGYVDDKSTALLDDRLREAIARYQADNRLIADGRINFDLYYQLLNNPHIAVEVPGRDGFIKHAGGTDLPAAPQNAVEEKPFELYLSTDRGPRPTYRAGETVVVRTQSSRDGYLYCYYQDGQGQIARIFPNRFQPNAYVAAKRLTETPPGDQPPFNIRMERAGSTETIACFATADEVGIRLPDYLLVEDLVPIAGASIAGIEDEFKKLAGFKMASRQMDVSVGPAAPAE